MSCNTPILVGVFDSATLQAVAANGNINFATFTSNARCNAGSGGTITLQRAGNYIVHVNVTTSAAAAGTEEVQLVRNGSVVPGAHAFETAAAAAGLTSMAFTYPITVVNGTATTLSVRSIPATNVRVATIVVEMAD